MRDDLEACYNHCQPCTENRNSRAQTRNKIDKGDLFEIFSPKTRVQMDFAERSGEDYIVMCDQDFCKSTSQKQG